MSLTARLAAAIVALVALMSMLSWVLAHRFVFRPLIDEVLEAWLAEVVFVAERLDDGHPPAQISDALQLSLEPMPSVPEPWRAETRRGRTLWIPPGPRNLVVVETRRGPVAVRRGLDLQRPGRRLPLVLLLAGLLVVSLAVAIARRGLRPLRTTTDAMSRMAAGQLDHRLTPSGPDELRAAADAFNQMADRIAGLLRAERELLAGISHELRTPLTRLTLEIELLRDAGVDPGRLDRMGGDLVQLESLVAEALELSRLQLGQRALDLQPTRLAEIARRAVDAVGPERPVAIVGEGPEIPVEPRLVERALANLIQNALKYTPPGAPIELAIDGASIEVRDRGPGVPPDALDRLFEPFFRTESGSRAAEGHGLGLMIVRQVVEAHGGRVVARDLAPGLCVRLSFATQ